MASCNHKVKLSTWIWLNIYTMVQTAVMGQVLHSIERILVEQVFRLVTFPKYSKADEWKAALSRIGHEVDDLDTRKSSTRAILGKRQF